MHIPIGLNRLHNLYNCLAQHHRKQKIIIIIIILVIIFSERFIGIYTEPLTQSLTYPCITHRLFETKQCKQLYLN